MKRLYAFILCLFFVPAVGLAEGAPTVYLLGGLAASTGPDLEAEGFQVMDLDCGPSDAACIVKAITEFDGVEDGYLIAAAPYSKSLRVLYSSGVARTKLARIFLLRAHMQDDWSQALGTPLRNAPPLTVLVAQTDQEEVVVSSRQAASAFRDAGVTSSFLFARKLEASDGTVDRMALDVMLHFMGKSPFSENFQDLLLAYEAWQSPPFDNEGFLRHSELLTTYEADDDLKQLVQLFFRFEPPTTKQWHVDTYVALDLLGLRDKLAPEAHHVALRNRRGQTYYLDLDLYGQYEPVIVTTIDDERNMYRMAFYYQTKAMNSWSPDVPRISARPLGPLLHFRKPVPDDLAIPLLLRSALYEEGVEFFETDPLEEIRAYPERVQRIITAENKCVYCHEIGSLKTRAHHIVAETAQYQGGFGLPLKDYSDEALDGFLYDQVNTAAKIGMTPNPLPEEVRDEFLAWVKSLRD